MSFSLRSITRNEPESKKSATKPMVMITLEKVLKLRKDAGLRHIEMSPSTTMDIVYIARFRMRVAVTMPPGMPSRIMKNALAGWPPVADGVMAEK